MYTLIAWWLSLIRFTFLWYDSQYLHFRVSLHHLPVVLLLQNNHVDSWTHLIEFPYELRAGHSWIENSCWLQPSYLTPFTSLSRQAPCKCSYFRSHINSLCETFIEFWRNQHDEFVTQAIFFPNNRKYTELSLESVFFSFASNILPILW